MRLRDRVLGLVVAMSVATSLGAQTVTAGGTGSNNCIPFGCNGSFSDISGYQQVFSSALFSGPVLIDEIDFTNHSGALAGGTYNFFFAYTNKPVGGLSSVLSSNPSTVFVHFATVTSPSSLSFSGTPFLYDPNNGNLLLGITISGWTQGSGSQDAGNAPNCSRAWNSTFNHAPNNQADGECLRTTLHTTAATPEPSTVVLLGSGLVLLAGYTRRRRDNE